MSVDIPEITESNQETLDLIAEAIHRIDHRTAQMEQRLEAIAAAWSAGGLRGLRQALTKESHGRL